MALALLTLAPLFQAQTDTTAVPQSLGEFMDQKSNINKLRWSRDVWWFNTDKSIDFHRENHAFMRLVHVVDPTVPGSIQYARELEAELARFSPVQIIHVLCAPQGTSPDTAWVNDQLVRYELRMPVAVFASEEPREILEAAQMPHAVLTFSGGRVYRRFSGHAGMDEAVPTIRDLTSKTVFPLRTSGSILSKEVLIDRLPKKLIASPTDLVYAGNEGRFYVSDQQRDRILLVDLDGEINARIGQTVRGFQDGYINNARFNGPSGLALDKESNVLYVADTYNHAIRAVNLRTRQVTTVLGTGEAALIAPQEVFGTTSAINGPTGLLVSKGKLYIAMTGFHQVWEMDLLTQKAAPIAGIGHPAQNDHADPRQAGMHGPSDLSFDGEGGLLILEAGSRNVRRYAPEEGLSTVFTNDSSEVKLLQPTALTVTAGRVFVSDSHRRQVLTLDKGEAKVYCGTGDRGYEDGKKGTLGLPEGLWALDGELYIADAFYGLLRTTPTKKPKLNTFDYSGFDGLMGYEQGITSGQRKDYAELRIAEGTNTIYFRVEVPEGYRIRTEERNEISLADGRETTRKQRDDGWFGGEANFEVDNIPGSNYLQFELYATFSPEDNQNIVYYRAMAVFIPFHEEYVDQSTHTVIMPLFENMTKGLLP